MFAEVFAVRVYRHLLKGQPTVQGLSLVPEQHDMIALEFRKEGLEARVIGHNVATVRISEAHADVLPDFDAHGTLLQRAIELLQRCWGPAWRLEVLHGKGGCESYAARVTPQQRDGCALLFGDGREVWIVDVYGQDAEVILDRLRHERARRAVHMHVRVDL